MLQKLNSARPALEHNLLIAILWMALGWYLHGLSVAHQDAKTQAAVHDALKAVPVAQAAPLPKQ